ncbi:MAG: DUF3332 domain-containing protein [Tannerellaceae bacterium]|nr:DUF3332 domain-containing protein [Tannerellaceae bacterium]
MKKKSISLMLAVALAGSMLLPSCLGSFSMFHKVLEWNRSLGDQWANEVVFLALWIIPVYEITFILDAALLNSIEFWTGDNPLAEGGVRTVEGKDGVCTVERTAAGYIVRKEGESRVAKFVFKGEDRSWSLETAGLERKLLQYTDSSHAVVYLPDGDSLKVELSREGVLAFRQALARSSFFAVR